MSTQYDATPEVATTERSGVAVGLTVFTSVILMIVGFFQGLMGLSAIFKDDVFLATPNYLFSLDLSAWGWFHLALGVLMVAAAWFLYKGAVWARTVGVIAAALNAVANFVWLPHTPVWSILIIALDVLIIWALTAHGRDITRD